MSTMISALSTESRITIPISRRVLSFWRCKTQTLCLPTPSSMPPLKFQVLIFRRFAARLAFLLCPMDFVRAKGKAVVAYWLAAHSLPGNAFPPLFTTLSLKNTGITHPVVIDVVSGEIRPVTWKQGTTDTLELLPLKDSIMAVTDESYFDWPVLPEAPSSLNVSAAGNTLKLTWQVHGGGPTGSVVERRVEDAKDGRGTWKKIADLAVGIVAYSDASVRSGQRVAYRVRAVNAEGESAYSNIARMTFSTK